MMRRTLSVLALGLALGGCSAATGAGPRSQPNVITQKEFATVPVQNTYDAIQRLRPAFLRPRTTSSGPGYLPVVYVDGMRKGSPDYLYAIPLTEIAEVRYLTVQEATTRYGKDVPAGVLDVKLIGR